MTQAWSMADVGSRTAKLQRVREPRVAPLNAFVDQLRIRRGGRIPYIDPDWAGVDAKILFVLLRPGPRAAESGLLSIENHDLTARYMLELLREAAIPIDASAVWNIVPWYGPRSERVSSHDMAEGILYLNEFIPLLPRLRSLVLVGRDAQSAEPSLKMPSRVRVFKAPHTSPSNLHTNPGQRGIALRAYRDAWAYAAELPKLQDPQNEGADSSSREKVLEHIFIGDLLRCLCRRCQRNVELLRAEADRGGYDLVIECGGVIRHIQLKSSFKGASTATQKININLATKPSDCVVWMHFDPATMVLGPFFWLGGASGKMLPPLGEKVAKHTKGNAAGVKGQRANIRVVNQGAFTRLETIDALAQRLFG